MDEVDAPLDGVNVERFANLLREFGQDSQFLIITHNPSTMESARCWYGVTMQEPGISRVLSMEAPRTADSNRNGGDPSEPMADAVPA
jgi:chromosome segregation protein